MRTRVQAKREKTASKEPQKPWAKLQPRPFTTESESDTDSTVTPPLDQAQLDRVANAPNRAAMPLYSAESITPVTVGSAAPQAKASVESNLKSPQGALQPVAEAQKVREEELVQKSAEPVTDEEELQMQTQLEAEKEETLQRRVEPEAVEEDMMQIGQDLTIAQDKKKAK